MCDLALMRTDYKTFRVSSDCSGASSGEEASFEAPASLDVAAAVTWPTEDVAAVVEADRGEADTPATAVTSAVLSSAGSSATEAAGSGGAALASSSTALQVSPVSSDTELFDGVKVETEEEEKEEEFPPSSTSAELAASRL